MYPSVRQIGDDVRLCIDANLLKSDKGQRKLARSCHLIGGGTA